MRLTSLLIFSTVSEGVFAGAQRPYHAPDTKPGSVSPMVCTSGNNFERLLEVIPTARSVPAFTCGCVPAIVKNPNGRWPAMTSDMAGRLFLFGMKNKCEDTWRVSL